MLEKIAVKEVRRVAQLANAARMARDAMIVKIAEEDLAEPRPARGEHNPAALIGLDPLPENHPARRSLKESIAGMSREAQCELRALAWIGKGDYGATEWDRALGASKSAADSPIDSLMGQADLHDLLMKGLYELKLL